MWQLLMSVLELISYGSILVNVLCCLDNRTIWLFKNLRNAGGMLSCPSLRFVWFPGWKCW